MKKSRTFSNHNCENLTSVIVSSYNQPNTLKLTLSGFKVQTDIDFELIIADDGSDEDTLELVEDFRKSAPFNVIFVTQEDLGFRKPKALNLAVLRSSGDKIIFCDGDCIPFSDFVSVHKKNFKTMGYCVGGYIYLGLEESRSLTPTDIDAGVHEKFLNLEQKMYFNKIHRRNIFYNLIKVKGKPKILGGNFSVCRIAFFGVNGFDEGFSGKGDSDIRNRLNNLGCRGNSLWSEAFVCHLDHRLDMRRCEERVLRGNPNRRLYYENKKTTWTERGIMKDSKDPFSSFSKKSMIK